MDYDQSDLRFYFGQAALIIEQLDKKAILETIQALARLKHGGGRLFILGNGGSAAHASHAVNDFRKINRIEAYAPTDNVAELTARTNDDGWETVFVEWLKVSRFSPVDALFVLSVGGGTPKVSRNIFNAVLWAKSLERIVMGIAGCDEDNEGLLQSVAHPFISIPVTGRFRTPHVEGTTSVILHAIVSHPLLVGA